MRISTTNCSFERDPLISRFGFKGGYLTELWQVVAFLRGDDGRVGLGLATQSPLWSDAEVFAASSEAAANSMMFLMAARALDLARGVDFASPFELLDELVPQVHDYGKSISGNPNLRLTFALNSLVAVDNAAWQLHCARNGISGFDAMIPEGTKPALPCRHDRLACVPLVTYGVSLEAVKKIVDDGHFLLKIKIGSDPGGDGDRDKMLAWDIDRLASIHEAVKGVEVPHTESGGVAYYLDANGRYDSKVRLMRLLDAARKMGAFERIVLLEEPFPEECEADVSDIPARLAADESAHSAADAVARMDMGYRAIALKPIAKTMSESLRIAKAAHERGVPCFCADLTVNPILVDWNKNVAARLPALPGIKMGVIESNGPQNYSRWAEMMSYHPCSGATWTEPVNGVFHLDESFYAHSGGILTPSEHYAALVS